MPSKRTEEILGEDCHGSGKFEKFRQKKEMSWEFNPPAASYMGSMWERQIRTDRKLLSSIAGERAASG